jgi:hypothetical protein
VITPLFDLDPAGFGVPHHRLVMRPNFGQDQADYTAVTDDDYAIGRIYEDRHTRPTVDGQLGKVARFRSKIVEIEAVRVTVADYDGQTWDGPPFSEMPGWLSAAIEAGTVVPVTPGSTAYAEWEIRTLEGTMLASSGDWIIRDTEGELYPCKSSVFERQYELVS